MRENNIKVNDIITILDENQKRNKWQLGNIEKLKTGKDGIIRAAEVKVAEQKQQTHSYNETPPEAFSSGNE